MDWINLMGVSGLELRNEHSGGRRAPAGPCTTMTVAIEKAELPLHRLLRRMLDESLREGV
jgi:hypothetical protein